MPGVERIRRFFIKELQPQVEKWRQEKRMLKVRQEVNDSPIKSARISAQVQTVKQAELTMRLKSIFLSLKRPDAFPINGKELIRVQFLVATLYDPRAFKQFNPFSALPERTKKNPEWIKLQKAAKADQVFSDMKANFTSSRRDIHFWIRDGQELAEKLARKVERKNLQKQDFQNYIDSVVHILVPQVSVLEKGRQLVLRAKKIAKRNVAGLHYPPQLIADLEHISPYRSALVLNVRSQIDTWNNYRDNIPDFLEN